MLQFFGLRKDSKKSQSEKESDGGFVIIGETLEEQRRKTRSMDLSPRSTNVMVMPSKPSISAPTKTYTTAEQTPPHPSPVEETATQQDLLKDVPFTLAPHVKAMQMQPTFTPSLLHTDDLKYKMSNFHYEFTLENSVLQNA